MAKTIKSTEGVGASPKLSGDIEHGEIVNRGPNREGETEAVSDAVASLADLTWEERKYFMRRFSEVFGEESNMRSQGKDFDTAAYK